MRIVIKKTIAGSWTNIVKIEKDEDWQALFLWLSPEQIGQLKKQGELTEQGYFYYVTSDMASIEFEKQLAPLLK